MLGQYIGKNVRLVGRIENIDPTNGTIILTTSDNMQITALPVEYSPEEFAIVKVGMIVEFVCAPQLPNQVMRYHTTDFGENFDLNLHEQLVRLSTDKHRKIFFSA
jgi:hypothetical protein